MTTKLFFNNRPYTFSDTDLNCICNYLVANESIDESDMKYVLSFVENSIIRKSYDEMDYHEFIIEDSFRISQLLCNIDNLFGRTAAEEFAKEIVSISGEETTWDSTNYFESIKASSALYYWERIPISKDIQNGVFQRLLGLMYLYDCVREDYMQTVTDFDDFGTVEFINGIVVKKTEYNGHLFLKPVEDCYNVDFEGCKVFGDICIPPVVYSAVFNTNHDSSFTRKELIYDVDSLFQLKIEQLTGSVPELKNTAIPNEAEKDNSILGKWYKYDYGGDTFPPLPGSLLTYLFNSDGKHKRSVQFGNDITNIRENWGTLEWDWFTEGGRLHILNKKLYQENVEKYEVNESTLCIGNYKFYRKVEEALGRSE